MLPEYSRIISEPNDRCGSDNPDTDFYRRTRSSQAREKSGFGFIGPPDRSRMGDKVSASRLWWRLMPTFPDRMRIGRDRVRL